MADAIVSNKGEWVVGLNPDDRAPNDWLRMVARVFAAYRSKPLKESIVAYIDGLNVTPSFYPAPSEYPPLINGTAILNISPGQAFVDDQFIGFIEDTELRINLDDDMIPGVEYSIVLQYTWINIFPPPQPIFELIKSTNLDPQQQLSLATAVHEAADGTHPQRLKIVDSKIPWYREMTLAAAMNTEVDGPELLPYIVAIKGPADGEVLDGESLQAQQGTLDVGWALDFHHNVGNFVNYNARLHTDRVNDGVLYINNNRILSEIDPFSSFDNDPSDPGDGSIAIGNNITLSDIIDENGVLGNITSDSGKSCLTLKTEYHHDDATGIPTEERAGKLCFDHTTSSLNLQNRSDYVDGLSSINTLSLTEIVDVVTINGHAIWHDGNLTSTGENIMFLGYHADGPATRQNGDPVQDGDTYYNTLTHTFWYYFKDDSINASGWVEVGRSDAFKHHDMVITQFEEGTTELVFGAIGEDAYNPSYVQVSVGGAILSEYRGDYETFPDKRTIRFNKPLREGEVVQVFSVLRGQAVGLSLGQLTNVMTNNVQIDDSIVFDGLNWVNRPISVNKLNDIGDVDIDINPVNRSVLSYDSATAKWVNEQPANAQLNDLADVELYGIPLAVGHVLTYMGSGKWENYNPVPPGSVITIAKTDHSSAETGFLKCDGASYYTVDYPELYAQIGHTFGGSGTTFQVPDINTNIHANILSYIKY